MTKQIEVMVVRNLTADPNGKGASYTVATSDERSVANYLLGDVCEQDLDEPQVFSFTRKMMSQDEYDNLDEFCGW